MRLKNVFWSIKPREFNLTSKGTLEVGKDADINMLDRNHDLIATYSYGEKHDTKLKP